VDLVVTAADDELARQSRLVVRPVEILDEFDFLVGGFGEEFAIFAGEVNMASSARATAAALRDDTGEIVVDRAAHDALSRSDMDT
jgi:hypothetical protein